MSTFHLWLVPTGSVYDRLASVLADLSARYRGPRFDPHLTLLGRLEGEQESLVALAKQLAHALQPFEVRLKEPSYEAQYFRCLFLPAEPSPSLLDVHRRAKQIFAPQSTRAFDPHVSLLYGLYPERVKQEIITALPPDLPKTLLVSRLQLIRADSPSPLYWQVVETLDL